MRSCILRAAARNVEYLVRLGVTHVLNTAEGAGAMSRMTVNTSQEYYRHVGITYKGLRLVDVTQTNISRHFPEVVEFLDSAIASGGKVLVNCHLGVSRSAACVMAFLITRHHMSVAEAMEKVRAQTQIISFKSSFTLSGKKAQTG